MTIHPIAIASMTGWFAVLAGADDATGTVDVAVWHDSLIVTAPAATPADVRAQRHLEQRIAVDFQETPLPEAIAYLVQVSGLNVVLAPALRANPPTVTLKAQAMTVGSVLRWTRELAKVHTSWQGGALYVSDQPEPAARQTVVHPVADLLFVPPDFPGREIGFAGANAAAVAPPPEPVKTTIQDLAESLRRHLVATRE